MLRVIGGKRDRIPSGVFRTDEGALALDTNFVPLSTLSVDQDGTVCFGYRYNFSLRTEIDREGRVRVLAGLSSSFGGDGGPARSARFAANPSAIAFGPDRSLVIVDSQNLRLRRPESRFPGFAGASDFLIPAANGGVVYRFDQHGRHLQTLHGLTGGAPSTFGYDNQGRLVLITDQDNNAIHIARDAGGKPTSISGPFGQVTHMALDGNGWLAQVTGPLNDRVAVADKPDGLLTSAHG